jgi:O-methyltransferase involved in polyketide biosynthesis
MTPGNEAMPMPDDLSPLREQFPQFRIWREVIGKRLRYVARSLHGQGSPHTVVTADLDELRATLELARAAEPGPPTDVTLIPFSTVTPNIARIYDYLLDGKDHYPADRVAARKILSEFPEAALIAQANRAFQTRAVRHAACQGIRQFIDLGAGLPTSPTTHESARAVSPGARVAYVDRDELVLTHARALLGVDDGITVVAGDIRDPTAVLASPALTGLIDMAEPVCILLVSILHFLSAQEADAAVAAFRERMATGSYLVISAGTSTGTDPELIRCLRSAYGEAALITGRTETEIAAWFDGLSLARPGLTDVWGWRPDNFRQPKQPPSPRVRFLAGVARKTHSAASQP